MCGIAGREYGYDAHVYVMTVVWLCLVFRVCCDVRVLACVLVFLLFS